jgi:hypothetical protein
MRQTLAAVTVVMLLSVLPAPQADPGPQILPPTGGAVAVMMNASAYLARYAKALSSVVSEERYTQRLTRKDRFNRDSPATRVLLSDYLLVAVSGSSQWIPFRDVYSVDGVAIRDRSDRLLALFVEAPVDALKQALRIRNESSRYNIGAGVRDINVPTFALQILTEEWRGRFSYAVKGRERVGETDAVVVEYAETGSPTLIVGLNNVDLPARGRFWIDPGDGRILRTLLETRPNGCVNTLEVRFRYEPRLELLVPDEMIERRDAGEEILEGRATYTNFRRFRVDTSMEIK